MLEVAHPHRPWTAAGDGLVMNLPPDQAAGHLRPTPTAVRLRRRELGLADRS